MSEAEAHAFEVNTFGPYNELSGFAGLEDVPNNFSASNVAATDYMVLPPDRELSTDDFIELNDLLASDPSFPSEFPAQNSQFMQYSPAQPTYNGHYDVATLPGPVEPTMPSIFDGFPPDNGGFTSDEAANFSYPTMQYPFPWLGCKCQGKSSCQAKPVIASLDPVLTSLGLLQRAVIWCWCNS